MDAFIALITLIANNVFKKNIGKVMIKGNACANSDVQMSTKFVNYVSLVVFNALLLINA